MCSYNYSNMIIVTLLPAKFVLERPFGKVLQEKLLLSLPGGQVFEGVYKCKVNILLPLKNHTYSIPI